MIVMAVTIRATGAELEVSGRCRTVAEVVHGGWLVVSV